MGILVFLVAIVLIGVGLFGAGSETGRVTRPRVDWRTRMKLLGGGLVLVVIVLASAEKRDRPEAPPSTKDLFGDPDAVERTAATPSTWADTVVMDSTAATVGRALIDSVPPAPPEFGGLETHARLRWVVDGVTLTGSATLLGDSGSVVIWNDGDEMKSRIEDLRLERDGNSWSYVGSNVRNGVTFEADPAYPPHTFHLKFIGNGNWWFDRACDSARCSSVGVELVP